MQDRLAASPNPDFIFGICEPSCCWSAIQKLAGNGPSRKSGSTFLFTSDRCDNVAARPELIMSRNTAVRCSVVSLAALLVTFGTACGSSPTSNRVLTSMALTPANADAQNFAGGQVQFVATGTFSKPPSPASVTVPFVAPYSGSWSSLDTNIATVDQNGLAQCVSGASGIATIKAGASSNSATGSAMSTLVSATATLTCP